MTRSVVLFVIMFLSLRTVWSEDCVVYKFEDDFRNEFTTSEGLCGFIGAGGGVAPGWMMGNYTSLEIEKPNELSTTFIYPEITTSCVSSFTFPMSANGVLEVNVYMDGNDISDEIIILASEDGSGATIVNQQLNPSMPNFNHGWNTIRLVVNLANQQRFTGYIYIVGVVSQNSIVLVDSFRYIPVSYDEDKCIIYKEDDGSSSPTTPESNSTNEPTSSPTGSETGSTNEPTSSPTDSETGSTNETTSSPTGSETGSTNEPTSSPTDSETGSTNEPASSPTDSETGSTNEPTPSPTGSETGSTNEPTSSPTGSEIGSTNEPTSSPTGSEIGSTNEPTSSPTDSETGSTSEPTFYPTGSEIGSTNEPTFFPTDSETGSTNETTSSPTDSATGSTNEPTFYPTGSETGSTNEPTSFPTGSETGSTNGPISSDSTFGPTFTPTDVPTDSPSPTSKPPSSSDFWNPLTIGMVVLISLIGLGFICLAFYEIGKRKARRDTPPIIIQEFDYNNAPKPITVPRVRKVYTDSIFNDYNNSIPV